MRKKHAIIADIWIVIYTQMMEFSNHIDQYCNCCPKSSLFVSTSALPCTWHLKEAMKIQ